MSTSTPTFRKLPALLFSALIVAATCWPLSWKSGHDSFPLSPYPMFSDVREQAWLDVVVGFDAAGGEHKIAPQYVANLEIMQAAQTIRLAVRSRRTRALCQQVAERVAADGDMTHIVELEVQRRKFDPHTYFSTPSSRTPLDMRHKARCRIERSDQIDEPGGHP